MRAAAIILVLLAALTKAETLDRIAARVGNDAITESTVPLVVTLVGEV